MKIGIAGNGKIVHEMIGATKDIQDLEIVAICSRPQSRQKAEAIADKFNIAKIYTDYNQMLEDGEIDFIYVAVANSVHYEYTKKALEAGKNVICEKPFTITAKQTQELIDLAKAKNLFLFEAITILYAPNYQYIKENLEQIGQLRYVHANYAQYSSRYDRYLNKDVAPAFSPEHAGGALYDLNIYNLHFVMGVLGTPKEVIYRPNLGFNGIDISGTALLDYDDYTVVCSAAKDSESISGIVFQGEKGYMELVGAPNACALVKVHKKGEEEILINKEKYNHRMVNEFVAFTEIFKQQDLTICYKTLEHSLNVMKVLEQARISGEVEFNI